MKIIPSPETAEESVLTREALEALARIDTEISRRRRGQPLDYLYKPHQFQRKVHDSRAPFTVMFSANRLGKTLAGWAELDWRCRGVHPFKETREPPIHCWWVMPSYPAWTEVVIKGIWKDGWYPGDESFRVKHHPQLVLEYANGSSITVMSQEQGISKFMGAAPDFIYIDEQCDEDIFEELTVRIVTSRGHLLYTATLVEGIGWEYDALWVPGTSGQDPDVYAFSGALCERNPARELEIGRPLVPHLTRGQILRMARRIADPQMRDVRIFGDIKGRTGLILDYQSEVHLVRPFSIPDWWPVLIGLDPGYKGFAASFQALTPDDTVVVFDEYISQREANAVRVKELHKKIERLQRPLDETIPIYVDTANKQEVLELNLLLDKARAPMAAVSLEMGRKAIKAGIDRLQYLMMADDEMRYPDIVPGREGVYGCPNMLFFADMASTFIDHKGETHKNRSRHIWEMGRWPWKEAAAGKVGKDETNDYEADGAHMMAAMRYGAMARFGGLDKPEGTQQWESDWETIMRNLGVMR